MKETVEEPKGESSSDKEDDTPSPPPPPPSHSCPTEKVFKCEASDKYSPDSPTEDDMSEAVEGFAERRNFAPLTRDKSYAFGFEQLLEEGTVLSRVKPADSEEMVSRGEEVERTVARERDIKAELPRIEIKDKHEGVEDGAATSEVIASIEMTSPTEITEVKCHISSSLQGIGQGADNEASAHLELGSIKEDVTSKEDSTDGDSIKEGKVSAVHDQDVESTPTPEDVNFERVSVTAAMTKEQSEEPNIQSDEQEVKTEDTIDRETSGEEDSKPMEERVKEGDDDTVERDAVETDVVEKGKVEQEEVVPLKKLSEGKVAGEMKETSSDTSVPPEVENPPQITSEDAQIDSEYQDGDKRSRGPEVQEMRQMEEEQKTTSSPAEKESIEVDQGPLPLEPIDPAPPDLTTHDSPPELQMVSVRDMELVGPPSESVPVLQKVTEEGIVHAEIEKVDTASVPMEGVMEGTSDITSVREELTEVKGPATNEGAEEGKLTSGTEEDVKHSKEDGKGMTPVENQSDAGLNTESVSKVRDGQGTQKDQEAAQSNLEPGEIPDVKEGDREYSRGKDDRSEERERDDRRQRDRDRRDRRSERERERESDRKAKLKEWGIVDKENYPPFDKLSENYYLTERSVKRCLVVLNLVWRGGWRSSIWEQENSIVKTK